MAARKMKPNPSFRRHRHPRLSPNSMVLDRQMKVEGLGTGGATVHLSPRAVRLITEMAEQTGQDAQVILVDSLNLYKVLIEGGGLPNRQGSPESPAVDAGA